ncbi:alpha/beta hydrolase [Virgibacillus necropolis]|uniref:Carboxylesterase n=1 Tax=Virgibacillus necropolis TaxID=163877 RepID=A0A221MFH8_9BACI|nr:alpha/beta hydrolase [Virgibacillus necropolis]ASN06397.1 carboxylesterase [Virgibacillus necropolis]
MKIVHPKSFTYRGGDRAVLLLHAFTGNTVDVKKLGKYLQKYNYTCHAPLYKGHGLEPNALIKTGPKDWWQDVVNGYQLLKDDGFEKIAVVGLSLGGVFSLKIGTELNVNGIVSMSVPIRREIDVLHERVLTYAKRYKQFQGKSEEQITVEMSELKNNPMHGLSEFQELVDNTSQKLDLITSPIFVMYGLLDDSLYKESANFIYDTVRTDCKKIKEYTQSEHMMTLGKDAEELNEDILIFLDSLDW